jgi:peptide/nickel transport system permease protein
MSIPGRIRALTRPLWQFTIDSVVLIVVASAIVFLVLQLAPGDPLVLAQGDPRMDGAARAAWARGFDGNTPVWQRWWTFLSAALRGDFGWSWSQQRPVLQVLKTTLPYTVALTLPALLLAVIGGVVVGTATALMPRARLPRFTLVCLRLLSGVPPVWIALMVLGVLAVTWPVFPLQGVCDPRDCPPITAGNPLALVQRLPYAGLPWVSLALVLAPIFARVQHQATRTAMQAPHVVAAAARGIPRSLIVRRHALRVTWGPLLSMVTVSAPLLAGGALFVERVYGWPGMGAMLLQAVGLRDYPLVTATTMFFAGVTMVMTMIADYAMNRLDPRPAQTP